MNSTHAGSGFGWMRKALPWLLVLAVSTSLAALVNTAVVGALPTGPRSDAVFTPGEAASGPCGLDADGALYAQWDWWLPAGRSTICRAKTYPGIGGPDELETLLARAGRLQATITFVDPTVIQIDLYCSTSVQRQMSDGTDYMSAAEARALYDQVCASRGSREGRGRPATHAIHNGHP